MSTQNLKESTKRATRIGEFRKGPRYKVNIWKSYVYMLATNNWKLKFFLEIEN